MKKKNNFEPWKFLDEYRGDFFTTKWPSLPQLFNITASRFPENKCFEAFVPKHITFTYSQAKKRILGIANVLLSCGVSFGDRVGLTGKNSPEWALCYLAILYIGAVVVPVDYSLTDSEIEHLVDFVEIKGLFVDGERFDRIGQNNKYGFKYSLEEKNHEDTYVLNFPENTELSAKLPSESDNAAFLFTSGTTGVPKAVMLTHGNLVSDCFTAQAYMNLYPTDVFYAILPIHHAYTMLAVFIESISCGANLIFGKKLVTSQIFKEMREGGVTMFLAVPMLYNKVIAGIMKNVDSKGKFVCLYVHSMMALCGWIKKHFGINIGKKIFGKSILSKVSLDSNRICISGGGPLPEQTFKLFNELGIDFVQGYGLTETSPILTLNPVFDYEEKSIGKPLTSVELKFGQKDSQGNGEILVRGSMVMKGYYKNDKATSEIIDDEGFLHTGDVGYQDDRGFVYLTGRVKNIIVTEGGKNVFPEEIEDHFQLYDDVEQICVLGYTENKDTSSEAVCAIVYPSSECRRTITDSAQLKSHIDEIVAKVNEELLPYKRIRKTMIADEPLEMTSTKKVKRFKVAEKYREFLNEK